MKFGLREHRGSLEESLKTVKTISLSTFLSLLDKYEFYCFDDRCQQLLFCVKDLNSPLPFWLFIQY